MQTAAEILTETARLFVIAANASPVFCRAEVETQGNTTVLLASLPINASKVTSYYVWIDGDEVDIRVYGSFASDDVETSGFGQTSAKKMISSKGLTAAKLAKTIASLGKKARS